MDIKIDNDTMQKMVGTAIMQTLDQDARDALITKAIAYLIEPRQVKDGYSTKDAPSIIQESFNSQLRWHANTIARQILEDDPSITERLKVFLRSAIEQALEKAAPAAVERMAEQIVNTACEALGE